MKRAMCMALAAATAVLAACGGGGGGGGGGGNTVRVGTLPIDAGAEAYYAKDKGIFKKQGLNVQVRQFGSGAAIAAAVASGDIDVGFSNVISLATARARGLPLKLIAPAARYDAHAPSSALVVGKDSKARSATDLAGGTIAVDGLKNVTQIAAEAWLDRNGVDPKRVRFLEIEFPDMPAALDTHRVDAALAAEPALTRAKQNGRVLANAYDAISPNFLIGGWFTSERWLSGNADNAKAFQRAIGTTATFANSNHAQTGKILAKYTKLPPPLIAKMTRAVFADRLDEQVIRAPIDAGRRYGAITKPLKPADLIAQTGG